MQIINMTFYNNVCYHTTTKTSLYKSKIKVPDDGLISCKPTFVLQTLSPLSKICTVSAVLLEQQYKQQLFDISNKQIERRCFDDIFL